MATAVEKLPTDAVKLRVIHNGVGGITESDVLLAAASNAIIIGFNIRPEPKAADLAEKEHVDVRLYTIIYDALNDIRAAMEGLLEPTLKERCSVVPKCVRSSPCQSPVRLRVPMSSTVPSHVRAQAFG